MMLLNERSLVVGRFCRKADGLSDPSATMGLLVEPDGTVVATDGHRLASASPPVGPEPDFPGVTVVEPQEAFVLPQKVAAELVADLKKKKGCGQPYAVFTGRENGRVSFATVEDDISKEFRARVIDDRFPRWREILPEYEGDGYQRVSLNPKYLKELAQAAMDFGAESVVIHVDRRDSLAPVVAVAENTDTGQRLLQVLMPKRVL